MIYFASLSAIQCLLTVYNIRRSPYTLVTDHVGSHLVNNIPTSVPCLELCAKLKQGGSQDNYRYIWPEGPDGMLGGFGLLAVTSQTWDDHYKKRRKIKNL